MESNTIRLVNENKIIVIVRGVQSDKLIRLAEAMYDSGIRLIEITYSADGSTSDKETANNIYSLTNYFGDNMCIGAGTVLAPKQVELTKEVSGKFIISPDTVPEVIKKTKELGMVSIPGALTPSEITLAHKCGADFVKIFPAVNLGTEYIKAVKAPLSHIKLLAVGGVNDKNMADYLKAGVCGFGIGSNIVDKKFRYIRKCISEIYPDDDFTDITPHCLRHTFATVGVNAGVPLKSMQALLGHADTKTLLDTYMHICYEDKRSSIKMIENNTLVKSLPAVDDTLSEIELNNKWSNVKRFKGTENYRNELLHRWE